MALDQQRRQLAFGSRIVGIECRVVQRVRGAALTWVLDVRHVRKVAGDRGVVGYRRGLLQDLRVSGGEIQTDDAAGQRG